MPFRSEAQRKHMRAKHPEIAQRWEKETAVDAKLPDHVTSQKLKRDKKNDPADIYKSY